MIRRLIHVLPTASPEFGGPVNSVADITDQLAAHVAETIVVTADDALSVRLREGGASHVVVSRSEIARHGLRRLEPSAEGTVLHVHGVWNPYYQSVLLRETGRACVVVSPRSALMDQSLRRRHRLKQLLLDTHLRRILRQSCAIHCTSCHEARELQRVIGTPPVLVPALRPSVPSLEPRRSAARRQALLIGRIDPRKRVREAIAAFSQLPESVRADWTLTVVGPPGADKSYYNAVVTDIEAAPDVTLLDTVDGGAKWALFQESELVLVPSLFENFGHVVAEALALSCAVVLPHASPWDDLAADDQAILWRSPPADAGADEWTACFLEAFSYGPDTLLERARHASAVASHRFAKPDDYLHLYEEVQARCGTLRDTDRSARGPNR